MNNKNKNKNKTLPADDTTTPAREDMVVPSNPARRQFFYKSTGTPGGASPGNTDTPRDKGKEGK